MMNADGGSSTSSMTAKEYVKSLPSGYRFKPTDEVLIKDYLMNKLEGKEFPLNEIQDADLYSDATPEELSEKFETIGEGEWYFFSPRHKKDSDGKKPYASLITERGYWKPRGKPVPVRSRDGRTMLGTKRTLCFYEGIQKTNWLMHEYRASNPTPNPAAHAQTMRLDEYVVCKVFKPGRHGEEQGSSS